MKRVVFLALVLSACGESEPSSPTQRPGPAPVVGKAPSKAEREVIPPEDEADQRSQVLTMRDVPLAVGAAAPTFAGYAERTKAVIVFFRGEW